MFIAAIVMIVLVVIVLSLAILLWEVLRLIQDRALIKQVLDGQLLLTRIFPATARASETQVMAPREREALQVAMEQLLPPGWATGQSDRALESLYTFVDDKKQVVPDLAIELEPLMSALRSKEGRQAIGALVDTLPNCPGRTRTPPAPGLFGLPSCVPAGMNRRQVVVQVQKALTKELDNRLRPVSRNYVLGVSELASIVPAREGGERPDLLKGLVDLRKSVSQMRLLRWILLGVAILGVVLATSFADASTSEALLWIGWPLLTTGIVLLVVLLVIMWRLRSRLYGPESPVAVQEWLTPPLALWQKRLRLWAGGLALVGIVLLIAGNVMGA